MTAPAPYAWQQLTQLVAAAVGVTLVEDKYLDDELVYLDPDSMLTFDPVRDDGDCVRLALRMRIRIIPQDGFTVAVPIDIPELHVMEYDQFNDGDPMKSFRLAVCRAILLQHEGKKL